MPLSANALANNKRLAQSDATLEYLAGKNGSLWYEWGMFHATAQRIPSARDDVERNALVEAFLVHFRILRDFVYPQELAWTKYLDDAIAFDYDASWTAVATDWKECSPNEKQRVDKLLAHLSYTRPTLGHQWPIPDMVKAIDAAFKSFITALPNNKQQWFAGY